MNEELELSKKYAEICNAYRELLCKQFDFDLSDSFWVGNNTTILMLGDFSINFDDVRFIVDNNVSWDDFSSWYEYTTRIKSIDTEILTPNLKHWCSGCPRYSEEGIIGLEALYEKVIDSKRILNDAIKEFKNKMNR